MSARRPLHVFLLSGLVLAVSGFTPLESLLAPKSEPWPRWTAHDPHSTATIAHDAWDGLLKSYVHPAPGGINRFAYGQVSRVDRQALDAYVAELAEVAIDHHRRAEQRAYWINLYNALTVRVVLDHYPVATIRDIDISPGLFSLGPWDRKLVTIEGEALSLNDIEHRILRPIWKDPRIHYAVNCAALGCPDLAAKAFTATNSDAMLEGAARAYVNHRRGARVENGLLTVSKIYAWYAEDFGGDAESVIEHLKHYVAPALAVDMKRAGGIDGYAYDWSLNDTGDR
ncbi:MAG: DUF547 domain-containing protein [Rhodospirillales bacterium]|jgi:hypothetical protein|nr:DUF547 domain-containing protein [Rhodospirillales bacterium]